MLNAFLTLHLSILLAGWTGVFGKMITLNAVMIVLWRCILAGIVLGAISALRHRLEKCSMHEALRYMTLGALLSWQWMFFYLGIKESNISVGVVSFSSMCFFTAIFEPLFDRTQLNVREIGLSLIAIAGIALMFHLEASYRTGIAAATVSAAMAAVITILMKRFHREHNAETVFTFQLTGGFVAAAATAAIFCSIFPGTKVAPDPWPDGASLFVFATFITIGMYLLQLAAMKRVSAFTVNLSYNLEPVYSVIIAIVLFDEARELSASFWLGILLIALSVALQSFFAFRSKD